MLAGDFEVKYQDNQPLELLATSEDSKIHPSSVYGITNKTRNKW